MSIDGIKKEPAALLADTAVERAHERCDGLTLQSGLTTPHVLVAEMGWVATGRSRRMVAAADSSKLRRRGFLPIVPLAEVDNLVTNDAAAPGRLAGIHVAGAEVVIT